MSKKNPMWGRVSRIVGLAVLINLLAAPVSNVAWVEEKNAQTRSLLGSYLAGRFARTQRDNSKAAQFYENALSKDPGSDLILQRTFLLDRKSVV